MEYELAYKKLANHANLTDQMLEEESLVFNLWQSVRMEHLPKLESLRDDVLDCFEVVNKSINGDEPSTSFSKSSVIDIKLTLAATSIIEGCVEYSLIWDKRTLYTDEARNLLRETTWLLLCGWNAVLHGDIDSITEHVQLVIITKELT